jgi:hypothetical protein
MIRILVILISLSALGLVIYLLFSNRQKPWNELTEREKQRKKILIASGTSVFLAGLIATFLLRKKK